jgi:hypothetical protein
MNHVVVGQQVHFKRARNTSFGSTFEVVKTTPKQVHMRLVEEWFPVFEETAFGRIANGENSDRVQWLKERKLKDPNTVFKAWKTGLMVGDHEMSHVQVV